jgi:hypothetical protein
MRPGEESSVSGVAAWISSKSLPSSSLRHLFEIESGGMPLLDTLQSHLRMFRASPGCFQPQPPKAAAFISPARQRWERIVADGKPRRGDIKSNRLSKATGVCREAAYLRSGLAYLRTRFERDGRGMTRASFWRKFRPRLRRENFPRRASCVRFQHQPPKAAAFISPARQRWGKDRVGREAPEGRHQIKSAFVADPPVGRSRR